MIQHDNYLKFVKSFCSKDQYRKSLTKPTCYDSGWVIATDAYMMLAFHDPKFHEQNSEETFLYDHEKKVGVNAKQYLQNIIDFSGEGGNIQPITTLEFAPIQDIITEIRKSNQTYRYKYADCDNCEGNGQYECPCCDNDVECKHCDGEGRVKVDSSQDGYYIFPKDVCVKIGIAEFAIGKISQLIDSMDLIGEQSLEVMVIEDMKVYFRIKNTHHYILVMGLDTNDTSHFIKHTLFKHTTF